MWKRKKIRQKGLVKWWTWVLTMWNQGGILDVLPELVESFFKRGIWGLSLLGKWF